MLSHAILPDLIVVIILFVTLTLFGLVIVELNVPRAITHIPTFLRGWSVGYKRFKILARG
jgi:hypothetical protein